jgi:hypothetical protein
MLLLSNFSNQKFNFCLLCSFLGESLAESFASIFNFAKLHSRTHPSSAASKLRVIMSRCDIFHFPNPFSASVKKDFDPADRAAPAITGIFNALREQYAPRLAELTPPNELPSYDTDDRRKKCEVCRRTAKESRREKLKRCSRCRVARYCSVDCQTEHWPKHKEACNV